MLLASLVFLLTYFSKPILAQDATPSSVLSDQYQGDYLYQRDLYQKSFTIYTEKSQINEKYNNITTQNDKLSALKDTLSKRNVMLKSYLMSLRTRLYSNKAINFDDTEKVQNNIKDLELWLDDQNQIIANISNANAIKTWATDFKNKYTQIERTTYTALVQNEINLDLQTLSDIINLTNQIQSQPQISDQNMALVNDIKSTSTRVNTFLNNASNIAQKPETISNKYTDFYPGAKIELIKAKSDLSSMFSNLKIIVTKMND